MRVPGLTEQSASVPAQPAPGAGRRAAQSWGEHLNFRGPFSQGLGIPFLSWEQEFAWWLLLRWHAAEPKGLSAPEAGCAG